VIVFILPIYHYAPATHVVLAGEEAPWLLSFFTEKVMPGGCALKSELDGVLVTEFFAALITNQLFGLSHYLLNLRKKKLLLDLQPVATSGATTSQRVMVTSMA
jgi:hypothetical protein